MCSQKPLYLNISLRTISAAYSVYLADPLQTYAYYTCMTSQILAHRQ